MLEADFIVVGAGSAGCALAARLSEDGRNTVLVIEYGGSDAGPLIQMPAAFSIPMNMPRYDWGYVSEPEPHLNGRRFAAPRGKVVGGSSSINGMVYVRGHRLDFDGWAEMGAAGWAYRDVLPYFRRLESVAGGDPEWRGTSGPLHVARGALANPLYGAFIEAGRQAGYPVAQDYNGASQDGVGPLEMTVHKGRRWSAANAYLKPALRQPNLRMLTRALVERVLFTDDRATGVRVRRNGRPQTIVARREVIVSASAFNAPKLLMQSGIGPAGHLRDNGIDVRVNRLGVGANLQDHLEVYVQNACRLPVSLNGQLGLIARGAIGLRWLMTRGGLGSTNHFEAGGFVRSRDDVPYPDLQMHFLPAAIRYNGATPAEGHGYQVHIGPMRSKSRGSVRLAGPDPAAAPRITFNYMSDPADWTDFRAAVRVARTILGQPAFDRFRDGELSPGPDVRSDAEIDAFVRAEVESAYHPCGTCRMGAADDVDAVVDPQCRVIGVDGLRVVDSSIFPQVTNGNLNAPSIMVGEKAADHILGRRPLDPDDRPLPERLRRPEARVPAQA